MGYGRGNWRKHLVNSYQWSDGVDPAPRLQTSVHRSRPDVAPPVSGMGRELMLLFALHWEKNCSEARANGSRFTWAWGGGDCRSLAARRSRLLVCLSFLSPTGSHYVKEIFGQEKLQTKQRRQTKAGMNELTVFLFSRFEWRVLWLYEYLLPAEI